jgi:hypothetical protein
VARAASRRGSARGVVPQELGVGQVLTGTPGGTALQAPPPVIEKVGDLLPTALKGAQRIVVRDGG